MIKEQIEKWNEDWDNGIKNHLILNTVLETYEFNKIQANVAGGSHYHWAYNEDIAGHSKASKDLFMMECSVYNRDTVLYPPLYESMLKMFELLQPRTMIRIKCNLYPATQNKVKEHEMHTDFPFSNKGAILSLNTCDGYTKLKDGTKVNSVENRLLLFDAGNPHCSSTCTNKKARFNINFNYF